MESVLHRRRCDGTSRSRFSSADLGVGIGKGRTVIKITKRERLDRCTTETSRAVSKTAKPWKVLTLKTRRFYCGVEKLHCNRLVSKKAVIPEKSMLTNVAAGNSFEFPSQSCKCFHASQPRLTSMLRWNRGESAITTSGHVRFSSTLCCESSKAWKLGIRTRMACKHGKPCPPASA